MKILYIHQYFVTPAQGGATRSYHLAKGLVQAGVEVDMITSHNKAYYDLKIIEGIRVHFLPVSYEQDFGTYKRMSAFYNFVRKAKTLIGKLPRPDLLYISSTPLSTGLIGLWAKRTMAVPFIFEVRDLWPEAPIQVGTIANPILKKLLYRLEKNIYNQALKIVALSPGIANAIRATTPQADLHLLPNFADTDLFQPRLKNQQLLQKFGLRDTFTIVYTGAIGQVNAVAELLQISKLAQDKGRAYQFVVMGKGSHLDKLLKEANTLQLKNFFYIPFGNKEKVNDLLACSDMAFISFDHLPVLKTNSPNKFFDAIAAGKSILVNHQGWVNDLVKTNKLGLRYKAHKPIMSFEALEILIHDKELQKRMQKNARSLAENHFSKDLAIQHLLFILMPEKYPRQFMDGVYTLTA